MIALELSVSFCNSSFIIADYTRADPGFPEEGDANLEIGRIGQGRPLWCARFEEILQNCVAHQVFRRMCLIVFLAFTLHIQTLLSVAFIRSVFWHVTQFQQNEHTPEADP